MPHQPFSRERYEAIMAAIFAVDDMTALQLFRKLKIASTLMSHLIGENQSDHQVSSARMRMLIRLKVHEEIGEEAGMLPSELSRHLGVSRNTVSALLNGLEEQALIKREINPDDRRKFLIRLTSDGRHMITKNAPKFGALVGELFEEFTIAERQQLIDLLERLITIMHNRAVDLGLHPPEPPTESEA